MSKSPTPDEIRRRAERMNQGFEPFEGFEEGGSWEKPAELRRIIKLPEFPVDALPPWGAAMVSGVAEETQVPADLPGVVYLGIIAAAAGGHARVDVRQGWSEPVNIFAAVAMPPGNRKSSVFAIMTRPVIETEFAMREGVQDSIRDLLTQQEIAVEQARKARTEAAKQNTMQSIADALAAQQIADSFQIPVLPRIIADDATSEALTSLLADHGGRIAVLSAEGDLFDIMAGRYTRQIPNLGVFLKGHAGDLLLVDRKGRPSERIDAPALTIALCIQPQVLTDIARQQALRGRGLLARVLYSLPPDTVGYRRINPQVTAPGVLNDYTEKIRQMVTELAAWTDPMPLILTPDAREILDQFNEETEPRLKTGIGDLAGLRDWASKLVGASVRIAGLLHLAEQADFEHPRAIGAGTMQRAVTLATYFTDHAQAAFLQMGGDPMTQPASYLLDWIIRQDLSVFSRRDAWQAMRKLQVFGRPSELDGPLTLLMEHGYIRGLPQPPVGRAGGRPHSPIYEVNPWAQNPQ